MAEGPHVELHLLGKMEVREAGRPGVGPGPSGSWAHSVLDATPPYWSLWEVWAQRSRAVLQASQVCWENPNAEQGLKQLCLYLTPPPPFSSLHLVKLHLLQEASSLMCPTYPV